MFGLLDDEIEYISNVIYSHKEVKKAVIFGSRAMGNYKRGSDVDIALFGDKITDDVLFNIKEKLDELSYLPYFFDILHYDKLRNLELKSHIDKYSVLITKYSLKS